MPKKVAPDLETTSGLEALIDVVRMLREPGGCPWDIEQTHQSLTSNMLEEAYEAVAAIHSGSREHLEEELGDVLLQVVLHAQIASEENHFDLSSIARCITEKLIRRHPHVFADVRAENTAAVLENWEAIKAKEKGAKQPTGILDKVGEGLPALLRAQKLQSRAARVGFDWPDISGVRAKVAEELTEIDEAAAAADADALAAELGDLLFAVVNLARHHGVGAEQALSAASNRFTERFALVEKAVQNWEDETIDSLETKWQTAKDALSADPTHSA
jgi:MazG family protein